MTRLADALQAVAVAVWVGSLWAIGLMAAPTLFNALGDKTLAAQLSARLLSYVGFLGLACGVYLLLFRLVRFGGSALRHAFFWVTLLLVGLTLLGQFWVQPLLHALHGEEAVHRVAEAILRDRSASWHGVPSVLYLAQSALALLLVVLQQDAPR